MQPAAPHPAVAANLTSLTARPASIAAPCRAGRGQHKELMAIYARKLEDPRAPAGWRSGRWSKGRGGDHPPDRSSSPPGGQPPEWDRRSNERHPARLAVMHPRKDHRIPPRRG